jgi:hypothetical protein
MHAPQHPPLSQRTSQALIFALCLLPFLVPVHFPPIPSFHSELLAGVIGLGLIATAIVRAKQHPLLLPRIAGLPLLFIAMVLVQFAVGRVFFYQQGLLTASYLILALGLMIAGASWRPAIKRRGIVTAMAWGFFTGGLLQSVIAACQYGGVIAPFLVTPLLPGYGLYGNIGQQNSQAHYLWLGLISASYLYSLGQLRRAALYGAVTVLAIASAYTNSRSAFLYPLLMLGLAFVGHKQHLFAIETRPHSRTLVVTALIALTAQILPTLVNSPAGVTSSATGLGRLVTATMETTSGGGASVRLSLLRTAAHASLDAPLLGHGPGAVPWLSFIHGPEVDSSVGVAEHFHFFAANWLVEYGAIVTIFALALLLLWLIALWRAAKPGWHSEEVWFAGLLLICGTHSGLEYPLWYSFFLAPVAFLMGAFDPRIAARLLSTFARRACLLGLALGGVQLGTLWHDHDQITAIYRNTPSGEHAESVWREHVSTLLRLHRESILAPHINGMLILTSDFNHDALPAKLTTCDAAMHYSPSPMVTAKCAVHFALSGQAERALVLARQTLRAFPHEEADLRKGWAALAQQHPEVATLVAALP